MRRTRPSPIDVRTLIREPTVVLSPYDATFRVVDALTVFLSFSFPAYVRILPLSAAFAFFISAACAFSRMRFAPRLRSRTRAVSALSAIIATRLFILFLATRSLPPANAVIAAASATPLFMSGSVTPPILAFGSLVLLTSDTGAPHVPPRLLRLVKHVKTAAWRGNGGKVEFSAKALSEANSSSQKQSLETDENIEQDNDESSNPEQENLVAHERMEKANDESSPSEDDEQVKMPSHPLIDSNDNGTENSSSAKMGGNLEPTVRIGRHSLAVVNDKDGVDEDEPTIPEELNRITDDTTRKHEQVHIIRSSRSLGWKFICVALMVLAGVLAEGGSGMMRALVVDVGDSAILAMAVSGISLVFLIPLCVLDVTPWLSPTSPGVSEGEYISQEVALNAAVLGCAIFLVPVYILRTAETLKPSTGAIYNSPRSACASVGSSDAMLRVSLARMKSSGRLSFGLTVCSLAVVAVMNALSLVASKPMWGFSGFVGLSAVLLTIASWLQSRDGTARHVGAALVRSIRQALGIVHAGGANTMHAAKVFIVQSQANRASWQVLNFFLFQAGMVLLESLYALTTESTGLILVSADNIFCCVGLALGLFTIRRTARQPASEASRCESLAGFANAVLLIYIAVLVILEAVERHLERGDVEYAHTFTVCVLGSLGNIAGLIFFPPESRRENHNVQGIYLHIWGNTLAFLAVAICTVLGEQAPDTLWVGVVGAIAVAVIIASCALPLLVTSARVLLRSRPTSLPGVVEALRKFPGVTTVDSVELWTVPSGEKVVAIRLFVANGVATSAIVKAASEEVTRAGYVRARTVVEVETSGHRRMSSSARVNMAELGGTATGGRTHRRSNSRTSLSLVDIELEG